MVGQGKTDDTLFSISMFRKGVEPMNFRVFLGRELFGISYVDRSFPIGSPSSLSLSFVSVLSLCNEQDVAEVVDRFEDYKA